MLLPLAAFLSFAASCAPAVAPETLAAIAKTESQLDPWAIHDNTSGRSYQPRSKDDAVATAGQLIGAGHSVDLGIMQISAGNFGWLGLSVEDAFEPCASIRAGATVLLAYSRYNTGSPRAGFVNGYVGRVLDSRRLVAKGGAADSYKSFPPVSPEAKHDWDVFPDIPDEATVAQPVPQHKADATLEPETAPMMVQPVQADGQDVAVNAVQDGQK